MVLTYNKLNDGLHCLSRNLNLYYEFVELNNYIRFFQILENGAFAELGEYYITELKKEYKISFIVDENGVILNCEMK